tara:strand:+ start:108 stop:398 length:291 start_codon:yes stop_codon:yes gene_type:complete
MRKNKRSEFKMKKPKVEHKILLPEEDKIKEIALSTLDIEDLETRDDDSLDFHDLPVWRIKLALAAAFNAGWHACDEERENEPWHIEYERRQRNERY